MAALHRDDWKVLNTLEQLTCGRRLDVGGFVLGDSFDTFLRNISEDYLQAAWTRLSAVLKRHRNALLPEKTGIDVRGQV